jgi:nucleoside-diphosphate-sugar epimerase
MKYLILGSSGQIGAALSEYLKGLGHEVFGMDLQESTCQDLRIPNNMLLNYYLENCDFVFFLAFDVGGAKYLKNHQHSFEFIDNNISIMNAVFKSIERTSKPMIFTSTTMAEMTHSTYGILKLVGERYTQALNRITVRLWNVYGIECDPTKTHVIPDFINQAIKKNQIDMLTDGVETRQFLHNLDCARGLYILSQQYHQLPKNKNYHLTSFCWHSITEVANIVKKQFPGCVVTPGNETDYTHLAQTNEPDPYVLKYWQPSIDLESGINLIIKELKNCVTGQENK